MASFSDIIGQEQIREHLENAIWQEKVSHAYIICGDKYSGKEFIAGVFAAALLCDDSESKPCGKCDSCIQAFAKSHPDIVRVTHEKPATISVDDVRTQINADVVIKPYSGKKKVYIVSESEKMNVQAQNALLKTLEEPPEYAVIMLLTTNVEEMLPTIRSRCVLLNMKPVKDSLVRKFLMEELRIPDYRADMCVAFARGNVGKAKLLASNEEFDQVKSEAVNLLKYIKDMEITELMAAIRKITEYHLDVNDYLDIISVWYRDVLLFKATNDANDLIFKEEIQYIRKVADKCTYEGIEEILEALDKAKSRLDANVNFDLTMELLFLTIKEK